MGPVADNVMVTIDRLEPPARGKIAIVGHATLSSATGARALVLRNLRASSSIAETSIIDLV